MSVKSAVAGHKGALLAGKLGDTEVYAMEGRFHFYEGYSMKEVCYPFYVFGHVREAGAEALIVGANEGVRAHHVDEVGNEQQGARRKLPVDAAAGVGQHHLFHVQR